MDDDNSTPRPIARPRRSPISSLFDAGIGFDGCPLPGTQRHKVPKPTDLLYRYRQFLLYCCRQAIRVSA